MSWNLSLLSSSRMIGLHVKTLLFDIARRDRNGLAKRFSPYDGFHELPGIMLQNSPETTTANALTSLDESVRHLGLVLFDHLALDRLPHETLKRMV